MDSVLRAYDKIYAKAYAEETALIDGLLLDLAKADEEVSERVAVSPLPETQV